MAKCSCLLFPSLEEGMGLTLMRAVQMRVPVIASDLPAVRELSLSHQALIVPDDVGEWAIAINRFLKSGEGTAEFNVKKIPSSTEMAKSIEKIYAETIEKTARATLWKKKH